VFAEAADGAGEALASGGFGSAGGDDDGLYREIAVVTKEEEAAVGSAEDGKGRGVEGAEGVVGRGMWGRAGVGAGGGVFVEAAAVGTVDAAESVAGRFEEPAGQADAGVHARPSARAG
jgi:hypothetical protein